MQFNPIISPQPPHLEEKEESENDIKLIRQSNVPVSNVHLFRESNIPS